MAEFDVMCGIPHSLTSYEEAHFGFARQTMRAALRIICGHPAAHRWRVERAAWPNARALSSTGKRPDDSKRISEFAGYTIDPLDAPLPTGKNVSTATPITSSADVISSVQEETATKAQIVFGSKLAGPADRRAELAKASTIIAGVMVPPRPDEPDNCCMSGCVNCVWDRYGDELEEWAEKNKEAHLKLAAQKSQERPNATTNSMDDDGGGIETNWSSPATAASGESADLFADIPVGIREFMRTEKKLKARQLEQSTGAG